MRRTVITLTLCLVAAFFPVRWSPRLRFSGMLALVILALVGCSEAGPAGDPRLTAQALEEARSEAEVARDLAFKEDTAELDPRGYAKALETFEAAVALARREETQRATRKYQAATRLLRQTTRRARENRPRVLAVRKLIDDYTERRKEAVALSAATVCPGPWSAAERGFREGSSLLDVGKVLPARTALSIAIADLEDALTSARIRKTGAQRVAWTAGRIAPHNAANVPTTTPPTASVGTMSTWCPSTIRTIALTVVAACRISSRDNE